MMIAVERVQINVEWRKGRICYIVNIITVVIIDLNHSSVIIIAIQGVQTWVDPHYHCSRKSTNQC